MLCDCIGSFKEVGSLQGMDACGLCQQIGQEENKFFKNVSLREALKCPLGDLKL